MRFFIVFFLGSFFLTGISSASEISVAAASSLDPVMGSLVAAFNREYPEIRVKVTTGASGKFVTQIRNGAPFDVFLSSDTEYPDLLFKEGLAVSAPRVYGCGLLVLWTIKPLDLSQGIDVLKDPLVKKIAIASPKVAPYGREAVNVIKHYDLYAQVSGKFVYGENLSQANTFVMTGAADTGITAKSSVLTGKAKELARWIDVPPDSYKPIAQGVVVLSHAKKEAAVAAKSFENFLFSDAAKTIFKESGYVLP